MFESWIECLVFWTVVVIAFWLGIKYAEPKRASDYDPLKYCKCLTTRRLAVAADDQTLLCLVCHKPSRKTFEDVRAAERESIAQRPGGSAEACSTDRNVTPIRPRSE